MKSSICDTEAEGVDGDVSDLPIEDGLGHTKEAAPVSTLGEAVAGIHPDVLVVSTAVDESWDVLGGLRVLEGLSVLEVHV
jgi:hypothetical protein